MDAVAADQDSQEHQAASGQGIRADISRSSVFFRREIYPGPAQMWQDGQDIAICLVNMTAYRVTKHIVDNTARATCTVLHLDMQCSCSRQTYPTWLCSWVGCRGKGHPGWHAWVLSSLGDGWSHPGNDFLFVTPSMALSQSGNVQKLSR